MMKIKHLLVAAVASVSAAAVLSFDQGNAGGCEGDCGRTIPRNLWDFMEGYQYEYAKGCTAVWHIRTAHFLYSDRPECPRVSLEKMTNDALKSIEYVKKNSDAKNFGDYFDRSRREPAVSASYSVQQSRIDAKQIWSRACIGAKTLELVSVDGLVREYSGIEKIHVIRLINSANQMVNFLGGVVNCAEQSAYVVNSYTGDIDIRRKNK